MRCRANCHPDLLPGMASPMCLVPHQDRTDSLMAFLRPEVLMIRMGSAARALLTILLVTACASGPGPGTLATGGDQNLLLRDQILESGSRNVLDAVRALRGNWLTTRGIDSLNSPVQVRAYIDDMRLGGVQDLGDISVMDVRFIRFYSGAEASARWGLDHGQGAIYVSTR